MLSLQATKKNDLSEQKHDLESEKNKFLASCKQSVHFTYKNVCDHKNREAAHKSEFCLS